MSLRNRFALETFEIIIANIGEFNGAIADPIISGNYSFLGENHDGDTDDVSGEFKNIEGPVVDIQK